MANKVYNDLNKSPFKVDYDDFESLAGIELTKAMQTFNSGKSNIFTYNMFKFINLHLKKIFDI